jgi:hypothetical protein
MKDGSVSPLVNPSAAESAPSREGAPTLGKIGFVGLGHMGTAMAANLANTAHRVTAYVRRPDQMGAPIGLGLRPTMEFADLFDCQVVISMLPDDAAVRDVVLGREDAGVKGLASGLKRGAIHLSMSTISTSAAAFLAAEHARRGQGYVAAPVFGNPDAAKTMIIKQFAALAVLVLALSGCATSLSNAAAGGATAAAVSHRHWCREHRFYRYDLAWHLHHCGFWQK